MSLILNIETSTKVCSVALSSGEEILASRESFEEKSHASLLSVFIKEVFDEQGIEAKDLDAVAVSKGPGSYTGLRIGVSVAKGLCYGARIPLIAIDTLKLMASGVINNQSFQKKDFYLCPMIDARRMEVYSEVFNNKLELAEGIEAKIIEENSFMKQLDQKPVYFFGDGSEKCISVIKHENAHYINDQHPLARFMARLADEAFKVSDFVDLAYFEPYYLKDFIATTPKKSLL